MADPVIVDDSIDSSIVYLPPGSWVLGGTVLKERDNTTHGTSAPGATATFAFNGTSVEVFGTIGPLAGPGANATNDPMSTYNIDGSIIATYQGHQASKITQYNVQFFQSPTLKPGTHTLVITNTGSKGFFFLDYLQFVPITTTTSANSTAGLSTATTSANSTAGLSTATPTGSQNPDVASSHSVMISTGALIGAMIGAVTVLSFIMAFLIWFLRRRLINRKRQLIDPDMEQKRMSSPDANPAGSDGR